MERSFSVGAPGTGNTIKLFKVSLPGATDISGADSLQGLDRAVHTPRLTRPEPRMWEFADAWILQVPARPSDWTLSERAWQDAYDDYPRRTETSVRRFSKLSQERLGGDDLPHPVITNDLFDGDRARIAVDEDVEAIELSIARLP